MAFNWNKFPWTNVHELNLDWIIQKVKELEIKVLDAAQVARQYIDRKINDLLTGAGDLEIDKTGTVRISGGTVDLSNARMTSNLDMAEHRIINLGAPVSGTDAVNKTYVDSLEGGGIVLRGTATFNSDGTITHVGGVDYSSVASAALANVNILLVLTASNVENTYIVMRFVGRKQLATSGSNRHRFTFISSESIGDSVSNVYGLDFDEGDDPTREKDAYFISRGVCDFYITGTTSISGALESVTFLSGWEKDEFDNLLANGARVRLVVYIGDKKRYFELCYTTGEITGFGGMYIDGNQSANIQIITYNGTTFYTTGLPIYGGEIV